jgi:hypothetical protein
MPPILVDSRELAEKLDVDYGDVLELAKSGRIPSIPVGKRKYFNLASVVQALRRETAPEPEGAPACA